MKRCFEYIGFASLCLFSFYYTDKVTTLMNSKDPIMKNIIEYKNEFDNSCTEGYVLSNGVVLGKSGKEVNVKESYSKMQGVGYKEDLMVFDEITCKVNLNTVSENYILKASDKVKAVSLFIKVNDMKYIKEIINKVKDTKLNILIDGSSLKDNQEYFKSLYYKGYNIIYDGENKEDLKLFLNTLKTFNKNVHTYCLSINEENKDFCSNFYIKKIRTNYYYIDDIYMNTKKNLINGSFYVYKENKNTLSEISAIVNFIRGKNINVVSINELLN